MPNEVAIRPWIGTYEKIGADIEAPGWGQRYSTPYIRPVNPPNPDYYHGPSYPAMDVRGRHPFRTQPRELGPYVVAGSVSQPTGLQRTSLVASNPYYAHGLSGSYSGFGLEPSSLLYALGALLAIR